MRGVSIRLLWSRRFQGDTIAMKQICSMMAGVVVELLVKPGDSVEDGMDVAILESMKMQLPVASTETGKVEEIKVVSGDFVNEGDLLMILS